MREIAAELKALRLYGMAGAWSELTELGGQARVEGALWLIEHLLDAEGTDRVMRSIRYQMTAARFPIHRDLAGFDFEASSVDKSLILQLAAMLDCHCLHITLPYALGEEQLATLARRLPRWQLTLRDLLLVAELPLPAGPAR